MSRYAERRVVHRFDGNHYLSRTIGNTGTLEQTAAAREAEAGSAQLRQATESLFRKWEQEHGFVPGAGRILVPAGYRE